MKNLHVIFDDQQQQLEGIRVTADIKETKILSGDGKIHTVDSEFVKLKNVDVDTEYVMEWLEVIAQHYQEAEITDVEIKEIDIVVNYIKKYLPENKKKETYDIDTAFKEMNRLISIHKNQDKETLSKIQKCMEQQQIIIKEMEEKLNELRSKSTIVIPTPLGNICATEATDPHYPGIYVDVQDEEGYVENAAVVEFDKGANEIKVHTWKQGNESSLGSFKWNENPLSKIFEPNNS